MTVFRGLRWLAAGCVLAVGFALLIIHFGPRSSGVVVAVVAGVVLLIELGNAVRRTEERNTQ